MDDILYEVEDTGVAYLTVNRPEARNALKHEMYDTIRERVQQAEADKKVRVMVIRGAGDKAFISGADIKQFAQVMTGPDAITYQRRSSATMTALESFTKPLIASINGACTGGGVGVAAACDLRIGTASVRLGMPIAKTLGNCPSPSLVVAMASIIGLPKLVEMVFTARMISGAEAKEAGFLNELVDTTEQLEQRVREVAQQVAQLAPLTLRATKEQVRRLRAAQTSQVNYDDLVEMCFTSSDFRNAVQSFIARTPPVWEGR